MIVLAHPRARAHHQELCPTATVSKVSGTRRPPPYLVCLSLGGGGAVWQESRHHPGHFRALLTQLPWLWFRGHSLNSLMTSSSSSSMLAPRPKSSHSLERKDPGLQQPPHPSHCLPQPPSPQKLTCARIPPVFLPVYLHLRRQSIPSRIQIRPCHSDATHSSQNPDLLLSLPCLENPSVAALSTLPSSVPSPPHTPPCQPVVLGALWILSHPACSYFLAFIHVTPLPEVPFLPFSW